MCACVRACVRACAGDGGFQANMYVGLKFGAELVKETKEVCTLSPLFRGSLQSPIYRFGSIAILNIHIFYSVFSDVDLFSDVDTRLSSAVAFSNAPMLSRNVLRPTYIAHIAS